MQYEHWHQYIGKVWAEILIRSALDCNGTIVEIGPGFTDKIGSALKIIDFKGEFYIVEPNSKALDWACEQYTRLLPEATIIPIQRDLEGSVSFLPKKKITIIMNHILDDMILSATLTENEKQELFSKTKPGQPCLPELKKYWNLLLTNRSNLEIAKETVLSNIMNFYKIISPQNFGISQYPSWFLQNNGLNDVDNHSSELLSVLKIRMNRDHFNIENILKENQQKVEHWYFVRSNGQPITTTYNTHKSAQMEFKNS